MSNQVKFVGVHRERERTGEGLYLMSDQVEFVGVHRERERRTGEGSCHI